MAASVPTQGFDTLFSDPVEMLQDVRGKWAVVSGASSGIGKATACALAVAGCNLVILARRRDRLEEIASEIARRDLGVEVRVVAGDINADETYAALREAGCMDGVDFVVINQGLARGKDPVGAAPADMPRIMTDMREMFDANCIGAFRLANEVLPGMIEKGGGHVVLTGSIAGLESYEGGSVYCASKHAAHAFMKVLRYETYTKNIRCTVVAPGFVGEGTEFSEVRFRDAEKAAGVYTNMKELRATDVAAQIVWAFRQPAHVCMDFMHVMPTCQGGATRIHRSAS